MHCKTCHTSYASLLVSAFCLVGFVSTALAGPKIVCDQPQHDFGTVQDVTHITHSFTIRNDGDAILKISRVKPACGCTTAKLSSDTLQPGASVDIETRLSLRGRRGPQMKTISVESNDPKTPHLRLELKGTVRQVVEVTPPHATFRVTRSGPEKDRERILKIVFNTPQPQHITALDLSDIPYCNAILTTNEAGRSYSLALTLNDQYKNDKVFTEGKLLIKTDMPDGKSIPVRVAVHLVRDVIVAPPVLIIKNAKAGEKATNQQIVIRSRNNKPLEITHVDTPSPRVSATVYAISDMLQRVDIRVVPPTADLEGKEVKIIVAQPDKENETISVPFRLSNR